jgi:hypothetical protein
MGTIVRVDATIKCLHSGPGRVPLLVPGNMRVKILNVLVSTKDGDFGIVACTLQVGGSSHPCDLDFTTSISWVIPAPHVFVNNIPVILNDSIRITQSSSLPQLVAPPNLAKITNTQTRVRAK